MTIKRKDFLRRAAAFAALMAFPEELFALVRTKGLHASNFHAVYDDVKLRDRFYKFYMTVFRLYPPSKFHQLVIDKTRELDTDEAIYKAVLAGLWEIAPPLSDATYGLPALKKQKEEMTAQSLSLLGEKRDFNGYLEIGSTGRYISDLRKRLDLRGHIHILNDVAPSYGVSDIIERGRLRKIGRFVPMGNYDPFAGSSIPDESLDLATNFIGFHHCPLDRLAGFVASIRRVLREGGRLLLRDHDVSGEGMTSLVALAHDIFNAGVGLTWKENAAQVRVFRSYRDWTEYLEARGFKRSEKVLAQTHDPTENLMAEFVKV